MPLTVHKYTGAVPPLVGVAVKVTSVPAQTGFELTARLTLTGRSGLTVTVTLAETTSPFQSVTVTVYGVVEVGFATGLAMLVALNPVAGDHE